MTTKHILRKSPLIGASTAVALALSAQAGAADYDHLFWAAQSEQAYAHSAEEARVATHFDRRVPGENLIWATQSEQAYAPSSRNARAETGSRQTNAGERLIWAAQYKELYESTNEDVAPQQLAMDRK